MFWRFRGRGRPGEEESGSKGGSRDGAGRLEPADDGSGVRVKAGAESAAMGPGAGSDDSWGESIMVVRVVNCGGGRGGGDIGDSRALFRVFEIKSSPNDTSTPFQTSQAASIACSGSQHASSGLSRSPARHLHWLGIEAAFWSQEREEPDKDK